MFTATFLSKFLQIVGAMIAFAGLAGESRLSEIDKKIRCQLHRVTPTPVITKLALQSKKLIEMFSHLADRIKQSRTAQIVAGALGVLITVWGIYTDRSHIFSLEALRPTSIRDSVIGAILLIVLILVVFFVSYEEAKLIANDQRRGSFRYILALITFFAYAVGLTALLLIILGFIALAATFLLGFLFYSFVILAAPIGIMWIFGLSLIVLIYIIGSLLISMLILVKIMLLPYQILDWMAVKWKLQSTLLLLGSICSLVGIVLDK